MHTYIHTYIYTYVHTYILIPSTSYFSLLPQHALYNNHSNTDVPHVNNPSTMIEQCAVLSSSEKVYVCILTSQNNCTVCTYVAD